MMFMLFHFIHFFFTKNIFYDAREVDGQNEGFSFITVYEGKLWKIYERSAI